GSYMVGKKFSILTFPLADADVAHYLRMVESSTPGLYSRGYFVKHPSCLSAAVSFIHGGGIKHMDIKPQNIFVRRSTKPAFPDDLVEVYLTDFGISRTVHDLNASATDGSTGKTEMYCSPEIAAGEPRGKATDVFSLGCVFAEMLTVMEGETLDNFWSFRSDDG
ncbi:kinase-like domain-containing protein, partial [Cryomyces antarcticus]